MAGSLPKRQETGRLKDKQEESREKRFEMEGFTAQEGLWNFARRNVLQDRGALPEKEGNVVREYEAMHEETS